MDFSTVISIYQMVSNFIPGSSLVPDFLPSLPVQVVVFLWLFHSLYVLVMAYYRAHLRSKKLPVEDPKRLKWYHYVMAAPWLLIGYIVDVIANCTVAWFVFGEPPKERLVTDRFIRYLNDPVKYAGKQYDLAYWVCTNLLDVYDPTEDHCKIKR
jgi:magnesium-transporting ATPase (P-type)